MTSAIWRVLGPADYIRVLALFNGRCQARRSFDSARMKAFGKAVLAADDRTVGDGDWGSSAESQRFGGAVFGLGNFEHTE